MLQPRDRVELMITGEPWGKANSQAHSRLY